MKNMLTYFILFFIISLVQFSCSIVYEPLQPHGLQQARLPCPSSTPGACSNLCPLSRSCHPAISSSVVHFCLQSLLASGYFLMSQLFASGDQSIRASASASVLPVNIQTDFLQLRLTGLISLQSKGLLSLLQQHNSKASILQSSVFFMSNSHIHT